MWRKETNPDICRILALVHLQALKGFTPGFYGDITLSVGIHNGRGGKVRCELKDVSIDDLTQPAKSGKN